LSILVLAIGFTLVLIQRRRKHSAFRTRLVSSGISMGLAGYLLVAALAPPAFGVTPAVTLNGVVYVLLALNLIRTDLGMWRWYRGNMPEGDSRASA
jgi:predicted cobalt transporter CbtA